MEQKMKFKIYQIEITKEHRATIEKSGHDSCLAMQVKLGMEHCRYADEITDKSTIAWIYELYSHVANIEATDLDDAYEIGNIGQRSEIEMIEGTKMHSISVGDIIENEITKEKFVVASFGFEKLDYIGGKK